MCAQRTIRMRITSLLRHWSLHGGRWSVPPVGMGGRAEWVRSILERSVISLNSELIIRQSGRTLWWLPASRRPRRVRNAVDRPPMGVGRARGWSFSIFFYLYAREGIRLIDVWRFLFAKKQFRTRLFESRRKRLVYNDNITKKQKKKYNYVGTRLNIFAKLCHSLCLHDTTYSEARRL